MTRRTVAGAAGGLKGVDYEDDRRDDPSSTESRSPKAAKLVREARGGEERVAGVSELADRSRVIVPVEPGLMAREEEAIADQLSKKRKSQRQRNVGRDRFSVDKDAPELHRVRRWTEDDEEEEEQSEEQRELEVSDEADALELDTPTHRASRAHLFEPDVRPEPGDLSLTDPDAIARVLGSPLAYAKHAMILAEAFRRTTGATRAEAIEYLARLFIAVSDRSFGRLAIKEFGPSSGILDIYPLEVIEHVLERYPAFLPKVGFGRLFVNVPEPEEETIFTDTRTPLIFEYHPDLKIRSFAISGGGRPGYLFEPDLELGKYRLHIYTSGKFRVLISAINEHGYTTIERLRVQVRPRTVEDLGVAGGDREYYPPRSAEQVEAWPIPEVNEVAEELSAEDVAVLEEAVVEVIEDVEITQRIEIDDDENTADEDLEDRERD